MERVSVTLNLNLNQKESVEIAVPITKVANVEVIGLTRGKAWWILPSRDPDLAKIIIRKDHD